MIITRWLTLAIVAIFTGMAMGEFVPRVESLTLDEIAKQIVYFDDSLTVLIIRNGRLSISLDGGATFNQVDSITAKLQAIVLDPYNKNRAFFVAEQKDQFYTTDQGKSFVKFELPTNGDGLITPPVLNFNAKNQDYVLLNYFQCPGKGFSSKCTAQHYYTTDGFKSNVKKADHPDLSICRFAKGSKDFDQGDDKTIICSKDKTNSRGHIVDSDLYITDDFFKTLKPIDNHLPGQVIDIRVELTFILAIIRNDVFNTRSKVSIFVSKDAKTFSHADMHISFAQGMFTFLELSPQGIFVNVIDFSSPMGSNSALYGSDSSGLRFTKLLDNVQGGAVLKIQTIDGMWLANTAEEKDKDASKDENSLLDLLMGGAFDRSVKSKYSVNNGRDWQPLKINSDDCNVADGCSLHVWSPVEKDSAGNFVSGPTPGIVMAVGNKGKELQQDISKSNTWISRDGGISWDYALPEPCVFSFGDLGNVIVAVPYFGDKKPDTNKFYYSLDQGKSWQEGKLGRNISPVTLTTTLDASSTNFILSGIFAGEESKGLFSFSEALFYLDFSKAFDKTCSDSDFETFDVRNIGDGPGCIYGHKELFSRRKQDAQCFVKHLFEDVKVIDTPCKCSDADFECARGFSRKDGECQIDKRMMNHVCRSQNKKELSLPDKVKISGDTCDMSGKKEKDFVKTHKINCADYNDGKDHHRHAIVTAKYTFDNSLAQYTYVDLAADFIGENIMVQTRDGSLYMSNNGGFDFVKVPIEEISSYHVGYVPGQVVLVTRNADLYVSDDGGNMFQKLPAPTAPSSRGKIISFHNTDSEKFIWHGEEGCEDPFSKLCRLVTYLTKDSGRTFQKLTEDAVNCDFAGSFLEESTLFIYCSVRDDHGLKLLSSDDEFKSSKTLFDSIVGYAITGKFVVVATVVNGDSLQAKVTMDGKTFANADFPPDFHVKSQQAYTVLDSKSQAIFLHVTTNDKGGFEYGSVLKSNSNGTSYVLLLDKVNRNAIGYVDYDRIEGLEGVIITNVVDSDKDGKKLKTMISHNDGGEWNYLPSPAVDSNGKKYKCSGTLKKCSLNLHGFTERPDFRDTFSSSSAVGLMIGVGNVGETLGNYEDGSTFLTTDGGITWKEVSDSVMMWEYGDRGTILVLVDAKKPTNRVRYSLDEGKTWLWYEFTDHEIEVDDLATVPADTSRKFIIFGHTDSQSTLSFALDFTGVYDRQCKLDLDHPEKDDYEYWTPKHPFLADACLFGHETKYLRRVSLDCFIGSAPLDEGFEVIRNCSCTRRDYECDYNYYHDADDTCKLVKGLSPPDNSAVCKKEGAFEYFEPTGYRKIPLSTCVGGKQFDSWNAKACPGKQKEFNKHYGREIGSNLLWIIGIPLAVFFFATWFVYDRGIRRNGGFKRLGQIRLEDDFQPIENNQVDKTVNSIVRGGIYVVAVGVAGFKTVRKFDRAILDRITSIFLRRPGQRSYVSVPEFEEELFGDFDEDENADYEVPEFETQDNQEFALYQDDAPEADARLFNINSDEESS